VNAATFIVELRYARVAPMVVPTVVSDKYLCRQKICLARGRIFLYIITCCRTGMSFQDIFRSVADWVKRVLPTEKEVLWNAHSFASFA